MTLSGTPGGQTLPPHTDTPFPAPTVLRWFLSSKEPTSREEYALMPGSRNPELESVLVEAGATATLSRGHRGRDGEMPWVTFCGAQDRVPILAVISTERSNFRDNDGREITPTRGLYADWLQFVDPPSGYESLHAAFESLGWISLTRGPTQQDNGAIAVPVAATDWEEIVTRIEGELLSVRWCAEVVGALLEGWRIAILPARTDLSQVERIRILDAIMALLPYGARNAIKASTWAASSIRHRIDLCFTDGAAEGQLPVEFGRQLRLVSDGSAGCRYRDRLDEIMRDGKSLSEVVRHLSQERSPWKAVDAAEALASLAVLEYPKIVYREISNGVAAVDRVCGVLTGADQNYPDEYRAAFIRYLALAGCADTEDGRTAKNTLRAKWSGGIARDLGAVVRAGVGQEALGAAPIWLGWARTGSRKSSDWYDAYLAAVFAGPPITPDDTEFGRFVSLAHEVLTSDTQTEARTGQVLVAQPHVLIRALGLVGWEGPQQGRSGWLRAQKGGTAALDRVLAEAGSTAPTYLRAVLAVFSAAEPLNRADLEDLARRGPAAVVTAIIAGIKRTGNGSAFDRLLPTLAGSFDERQRLTEPDVQAIAELVALAPQLHGTSKASLAQLDMLAVKADCRPPNLNVITASSDDYLTSLQKAWLHLIPGPMRRRGAQVIAGTILAGGLNQSAVDALDRVASYVRADFVRDTVQLVAKRLEQDRTQCVDVKFPAQWNEPLAAMSQLRWFKALGELEGRAAAPAGAHELVGAVYAAFSAQCTVGEVLHCLVGYLAAAEPAAIDGVLLRLSDQQGLPDIRTGIRDLLLTGGCGDQANRRFREYANTERRWYEWCAGLT